LRFQSGGGSIGTDASRPLEAFWMLKLRTFGGLSIESAASIGGATANRRPLALLALLAVSG
jgi:hypothetical protein